MSFELIEKEIFGSVGIAHILQKQPPSGLGAVPTLLLTVALVGTAHPTSDRLIQNSKLKTIYLSELTRLARTPTNLSSRKPTTPM